MRIANNVSTLLKMSFRSLAIVVLFAATTNCTNDESLIDPQAVAPEVAAEEVAVEGEVSAASLTVSGAFVEYTEGSLCSECTYVIPEDASIVDGEKIGIKAGDVICLNSTFSYKAVEVVNVEGTEAKPVIIANCAE